MIENRVYGNYATFASSSQTPGPSGSLESIHGAYHFFIGGISGHMSSVPIAAFDPVFWIHHWYGFRLLVQGE
jgi:tyrosinase